MGVGGNFWDLLKPYAQTEGFDFLRNKRVAVDLSFWIVQHETAIKSHARKPHLRLTFFRTINLFAKFGAFPVFVVDGTPSPLKSKARIARFFRFSGVDLSSFPAADHGVSVERNRDFLKFVEECVELIKLFGIPVLKAKGEAEALCAQLEREGHVDACITSHTDSDAFLYGAKCVIKCIRPNSKEPFECYHMSAIETGLGLKRKQLIAISLMVGNDHDINGVQGIGLDTALRFVQTFGEDEILNRLHEMSNRNTSKFHCGVESVDDSLLIVHESSSPKTKHSHCSFCGHPGSKTSHLRSSCEYCCTDAGEGCLKKPDRFKCDCLSCDKNRKDKEQKKQESWQTRVCTKIAMQPNFPKDEIIEMYLSDDHGISSDDGPGLSWGSPKTELLVDFLAFHQLWEPSYIRQKLLPMLSTIYLRELASTPENSLFYDQYEFDSIDRVKIRYGHAVYVVRWRKPVPSEGSVACRIPPEEPDMQQDVMDFDESINVLEEVDAPKICVDDGCCFLLTEENMELVQAAFPEKVERFLRGKELKESKRRKVESLRSEGTSEKFETPRSSGVQLSITKFYKSTKFQKKPKENVGKNIDNQGKTASNGKRKESSQSLPKSVRRRLLFG